MVTAFVIEEELLGNKISGECDGGYSEAREGALEAVEAGEGTGVSPLLTGSVSTWGSQDMSWVGAYYRAHGSPFVPLAEAAANFLGSKPVMEGRGAMVMELGKSAMGARDKQQINQAREAWMRTV
jgi:hypothetical protein